MTPQVPTGEIPISLVSRQCADGATLGWVAALLRLHVGMSWCEEGGEGTLLLHRGWEPLCKRLGVSERAAQRAKVELVSHGALRWDGRLVVADRGLCTARSVNRGICRILLEHLREQDDRRIDTIAASAMIGIDLLVRGRLVGDTAEGDVFAEDLHRHWRSDPETISHALSRLRNHRVLVYSRGASGGRGLGHPPMHYALQLPPACRGQGAIAEPAPLVAAPPLTVPSPDLPRAPHPAAGADLRIAFSMHLGFAQLPGAHVRTATPGTDLWRSPTTDYASDIDAHRAPNSEARNCGQAPISVPQAAEIPIATRSSCGDRCPPASGSAISARISAPQETCGDIGGGGGETPATANPIHPSIPPFPPEHPMQLPIAAAAIWGDAEQILEQAKRIGLHLAMDPHLGAFLTGLRGDQVIPSLVGLRIEDAWDLRVALYKARIRNDPKGLWHADIETTLRDAHQRVHHKCVSNEEARGEWMVLLANRGLRLTGVLAVFDALRDRGITEPYARYFDSAIHDWARTRATSVHLIGTKAAKTSRPKNVKGPIDAAMFASLPPEQASTWTSVGNHLVSRSGFSDDRMFWTANVREFAAHIAHIAPSDAAQGSDVCWLRPSAEAWHKKTRLRHSELADAYRLFTERGVEFRIMHDTPVTAG